MDYLRSWTGRARVSFTHAPEPIDLRTASGGTESLLKVCEEATPPCQLNPLLFNGHLQTVWSTMRDRLDVPIYYKRRVFTSDQGDDVAGSFAVDFVVPPYPLGEDKENSKDDNDNEEEDDGAAAEGYAAGGAAATPSASLPPRTTYFTDAEFAQLGQSKENSSTTTTGGSPGSALADDDDRPMLICLHGLTGGSFEPYLRAVLEPLVSQEAGWAACVINSRGCAGSSITSGILYNARSTWDCRQIVAWCRRTWPRRRLYGIGFSLGANMMTNYVAEEGDNCLLEAAIVVSNPFSLDIGSLGLQRTLIGKQVYSRAMCKNLKGITSRHADILLSNSKLDLDAVFKTTYLHEFDRALQCPCWGYPTEMAYYRDASCTDAINAIRRPFLAINSEDDPVALNEAIPYLEFTKNPYTVLLTTSMGGHLGWYEDGGRRWFPKPIANFLIKMATEVEAVAKPSSLSASNSKSNADSGKSPIYTPARHKLLLAGIE